MEKTERHLLATPEQMLEMYRWLKLTRDTEAGMVEYHQHTPITELPHSSMGQEAVSVGCCYPLREDDLVHPSLRTRGAFLIRGISSRVMMAGALGKVTGAAHGKSTSHHMGDKATGVVVGTGCVAGNVPVAVGTALGTMLQGKDSVTVVFFGDGACNRGDVHECMNMASVFNLPIIFVIENNRYALTTPASFHSRVKDLASRASAYDIPGVTVDGNDVMAVYGAMLEAIRRARAMEGPTVLECKTYRYRRHSEREPHDLRPEGEIEYEMEHNDPVKRYVAYLLENGFATQEQIDAIDASVKEEVADAFRFAEESPYPEPEKYFWTNVYAED
ncbi:MAG: thiamine pyrophosphate-dependent dehydrogenase E1 component subunit alpha [Clostridia bacterium]|nr:thiamine pyrophosphate-dependent dehydrogenase E1 component subunit alpha [Clostridia bacterium]